MIFGTNLLAESPMQLPVFSLSYSPTEKEYQTESKQDETFAMIFLGPKDNQVTWRWSLRRNKATMRKEGVPRG